MKVVREAASCFIFVFRLFLVVSGAYVIFTTGWNRLLEDPLYALVAIIFYYLIFALGGDIADEEEEEKC